MKIRMIAWAALGASVCAQAAQADGTIANGSARLEWTTSPDPTVNNLAIRVEGPASVTHAHQLLLFYGHPDDPTVPVFFGAPTGESYAGSRAVLDWAALAPGIDARLTLDLLSQGAKHAEVSYRITTTLAVPLYAYVYVFPNPMPGFVQSFSVPCTTSPEQAPSIRLDAVFDEYVKVGAVSATRFDVGRAQGLREIITSGISYVCFNGGLNTAERHAVIHRWEPSTAVLGSIMIDLDRQWFPSEACRPDLDDDGVAGNSDIAIITGSLGVVTPNCDHADVNSDGVVNATDLAVYLAAWGQRCECPWDFNGDGLVGAADLAELLGSWSEAFGGSSGLAQLLGSWGPC